MIPTLCYSCSIKLLVKSYDIRENRYKLLCKYDLCKHFL